MKIIKPEWVSHFEMPIVSIDIHPDGSCFATGGQGRNSGLVIIWNTAPIFDEAVQDDEQISKIFCQMENHLACVNCVRWSHSGKCLASGGDDNLVMIWKKKNSSENTATWSCAVIMDKHTADVMDVAWSTEDTFLATCSVDNTIIVWDAAKFHDIVAVLKGHTGFVKGVAWDPLGYYLVSQADDKTVRIWRCEDWKQEAVITEPFKKCAATTLFLRLDWSPDGKYIVTAHARSGPFPVAQIIERDTWKLGCNFVGHRNAITSVQFNRNTFQRQFHNADTKLCVAMASNDRSISVWSTDMKRPLVVLTEAFEKPILDLTWSYDGLQLMACSSDGKIICFQFSAEELGGISLPLEKKSLLKDMHKNSSVNNKSSCGVIQSSCLENTNLIDLEEDLKVTVIPRMKNMKQTEELTHNGYRRITPVLLTDVNSRKTLEQTKTQTPMNTVPTVKRPVNFGNFNKHLAEPKVKVPRFNDNRSTLLENTPNLRKTKYQRSCDSQTQTDNICLVLEQLTLPYVLTVPLTNKHIILSNESQSSPLTTVTMKSSKTGSINWQFALSSPVCSIAANTNIIALGCIDASLHLLQTRTGIRMLPIIILPKPCKHIVLGMPALLLCLMTDGSISVWNLTSQKALVVGLSIAPLVASSPGMEVSISNCILTDDGAPVIALSSGKCFMYSLQLSTWMLLSDASDLIVRNLQEGVQSCFKAATKINQSLKSIQSQSIFVKIYSCFVKNKTHGGVSDQLSEPTSSLCTTTFLEQQLSVSKVLKHGKEYHFWLITAVRFYAQQGDVNKLRFVCEDLLGPLDKCHWERTILGMEKHSLLKDVLTEICGDPRYQRLYSEFIEQLKN